MSMFNDKEIKQAKEKAIQYELKKHGLGHLRATIKHSHGGRDEIELSGGTGDDLKRATVALGGKVSDLSSSEFGNGIQAIKSPRIESVKQISSEPKVDTIPKLKT